MKKAFLVGLLVLVSVLYFSVNILAPVGPTVISLAGALENRVESKTELNIKFWTNIDQIASEIVTSRTDIVILPVSMAAELYNNKINIKLAAVSLWKSFYIVSKDFEGKTLESLAKSEIYTPQGKGQTGDIMIRYLLERSSMQADKDVLIKYASAPEIVGLLSVGRIKHALLPEPFISLALMKAPGSKISFDLQELWGQYFEKGRVPITAICVTAQALKEKPEEIAKALEALERSVLFSIENREEALTITTKYLESVPLKVLNDSMERSSFEYLKASETKEEILTFLEIVMEVDPLAMKQIPDDGFFLSY